MMRQAPIPVGGGQLSTGGRLTMAGIMVDKPGLSSDRRMKHAAVKPEPERAFRRSRLRLHGPSNRRGETNGGERGTAAAKPARPRDGRTLGTGSRSEAQGACTQFRPGPLYPFSPQQPTGSRSSRQRSSRATPRANRTRSLDVASTHTQGDWRWRAHSGSSGIPGTRASCVNIAGRGSGRWPAGPAAITARAACGPGTWTSSP